MCFSFPGRVVAVDDEGATVESGGVTRRASTLVVRDVQPGDWVVVAAGTILTRLGADEAALIADELTAAGAVAARRKGKTRS